MDIKASDVKKLRQASGAGMMDAKRALTEASGDVDKALEILRKKGQKIAAKKSVRQADEGLVGIYLHTNGKVASLVKINCETDFVARTQEFKKLSNDLAMQVVAMEPVYLAPEDIPEKVVNKEKEVYQAEMKDSGKPAKVVDKIVEGKLEKFYSQVCLLKQPFIKDDSLTVERLITDKIATIGENIRVGEFVRFSL